MIGAESVDDPDEATVPDPAAPDDEPTTIRPSPLPAKLLPEASMPRGASRGFASSLRGRVGKYELRDKLGRGAFGVVFTARDPSLDRDVAIKVLRPTHLTNQEIVQRFLQEARATARIAHPGIVTIHDCGRLDTDAGTTAFIAMELLSGESLTGRLMRCGRLPPHAAIEIARQVASALEAAHRADVLHRDLKPDNIYLVPDPAMPTGERVKVLDFGLAKLGQDGHTQLQTVFGTPRYMSPEQCRSAAQVDHRSDIYSLGCILFELATGRLPFDGDVRQLIERHQRAIPPRASTVIPGLPPALDDLIAEMLAKDPMDRPQTMGAVQRALYRASGLGPPPDPEPRPTEAWAVGTDPAQPSWLRNAQAASGVEALVFPEPSRLADRPAAHEPRGDQSFPVDLSSLASRSAEPRGPRGPSEPFVIAAVVEPTTPEAFAIDHFETLPTPKLRAPGTLSGEILVPPSAPHAELALTPIAVPRTQPRRSAAATSYWLLLALFGLLAVTAGLLTRLATS